MPALTVELEATLVSGLRVEAAHRDVPLNDVIEQALVGGLHLLVLRRGLMTRPNSDTASRFRIWLISHIGCTDGSARTLSSLARKAVQRGDLGAYVVENPQLSAAQSAVTRWLEYCEASGHDPLEL